MELHRVTIAGAQPNGSRMAWSPDGRTLALAGSRPGPSTWELGTAKVSSLTAHPDYVGAIAYLPQAGELVVGTSTGDILRVNTYRQRVTQQVKALQGEVFQVAVSPDGEHVAACCNAGWLWVGRTADLSTVMMVQAHEGVARHVAWSPSGERVATGGNDGTVRVWTLSGEPDGGLGDHRSAVTAVAYSPDGTLLGSSSNDSSVRLWRLAQQCYERVLDRFDGWWVWDFAFSPDGAMLATVDQDPALAVWRVHDGALLWRGQVGFGINHLAWHPAEPLIAVAGSGRPVELWRLEGAATDQALPPAPRAPTAEGGAAGPQHPSRAP